MLQFGETEEVLYIFARQDLKYKWENYTNGTMNNDTVIKNNTLVRLNWAGNITFGFGFGNNSGNRFMDFIYVDQDVNYTLVNITSNSTNSSDSTNSTN